MPVVRMLAHVGDLAIFRHSQDEISDADINLPLIQELVARATRLVTLPSLIFAGPVLASFMEMCATFEDNTSQAQYRGFKRNKVTLIAGNIKSTQDFHFSFGQAHLSLFYFNGHFYLFDFSNWFAANEPNIQASVIVFKANQFHFEKIMELTDSRAIILNDYLPGRARFPNREQRFSFDRGVVVVADANPFLAEFDCTQAPGVSSDQDVTHPSSVTQKCLYKNLKDKEEGQEHFLPDASMVLEKKHVNPFPFDPFSGEKNILDQEAQDHCSSDYLNQDVGIKTIYEIHFFNKRPPSLIPIEKKLSSERSGEGFYTPVQVSASSENKESKQKRGLHLILWLTTKNRKESIENNPENEKPSPGM